jgi:hypothetical protein
MFKSQPDSGQSGIIFSQDPSQQQKVASMVENLELAKLTSLRIVHYVHAFGCIIESKEHGWKVVFSGDSRPCPQLVEVSMNATLLIHEATFNDRMISEAENLDYNDTTTLRLSDQEEEKEKKRKKGDNKSRSEIRTKQYEETKLLNFYNQFGIRFQNIATNDALIISKINALASKGWELAFVSGSAEAMSGYDDPNGIIYTRYIFKREKK